MWVFVLFSVIVGIARGSVLNVTVDQPGHIISPDLWGIFFEEINHAGDGGLYAELIQNRALAQKTGGNINGYSVVADGNNVEGKISVSADDPLNDVLTRSLKLEIVRGPRSDKERVGLSNRGYFGIPIRPDYTSYRASFYAKTSATFRGPLTVTIESSDGKVVYASAQIPQITDQFQKYEVVLTPNPDLIQVPNLDNIFTISASGPVDDNTVIFFQVVSLFPPTFKDRPNGMRIDIAQKLADAKPSFLRFPGGNFLEGNNINERFIWEETIGDISQRPGHQGCWGYYSSDGLGLLEYLQLAEDLNADTVLAVFAGYALNGETTAPEDLGPYVESALNEIEYAIGDANTTWGARRAADGHPEPFKVSYVEIGNEDFFSKDYEARYPVFYDAISQRYPQLQIIATTGVQSRPVPILDDHYYPGFGWFPDNHRHYDDYPRDGSKIFVGEYACRDNAHEVPEANTAAAMDDAAWMTGLERNSDVVILASYAPLFGHFDNLVWTPDAIYFNGLESVATPGWWVQHLFSVKRGDLYIPTSSDANNGLPNEKIFHVASWKQETNTLILKVVNTLDQDLPVGTINLQGVNVTKGGTFTILTGGRWDQNDLDNPLRIAPKSSSWDVTSNTFDYVAPAMSLSIFEINL